MTGGRIEGKATGNVVIDKGETSYCSLIKSGGTFNMNGGLIALRHQGDGGRCISVDSNLTIIGGTLDLENNGHGGSYLRVENDSDYYTPKCITVNGCARLERGQFHLLATGNGGKGIDCSDTLFIGRKGEEFFSEDSLLINVETRGSAIVDNVDEDYRKGCPKAIKSDGDVYAYSGTIRIHTNGQGGEGIEGKKSLRAYHSTIIADCYDDGINTGMRCYIDGAHIFCLSHHNDGIDSNGKISIADGIVAAISEHSGDESFDTNGGQLNLYGGHIIGIGFDDVEISDQSTIPYYSTPSYLLQDYYHHGDSIAISQGGYLTISEKGNALISLYHDHSSSDAFITIASASLEKNHDYTISDGEKPNHTGKEWCDARIIMGGTLTNYESLITFNP
jgi:hypothetical protein